MIYFQVCSLGGKQSNCVKADQPFIKNFYATLFFYYRA